MNKKILIIGALISIFAINFCGCNGIKNFEKSSDIKLVNYSVLCYKYGREIELPIVNSNEEFNYEAGIDGFRIDGTIINELNVDLKKIKIIGNFYYGNKFIGNNIDIIENISNGEVKNFRLYFPAIEDYLKVVDNVKFDFEILRD